MLRELNMQKGTAFPISHTFDQHHVFLGTSRLDLLGAEEGSGWDRACREASIAGLPAPAPRDVSWQYCCTGCCLLCSTYPALPVAGEACGAGSKAGTQLRATAPCISRQIQIRLPQFPCCALLLAPNQPSASREHQQSHTV